MSGIFNLFGRLPETDKGQILKPYMQNSSNGINAAPVKTGSLINKKPKGLSIRSNSDLNVSASSNNIISKNDTKSNESKKSNLNIPQNSCRSLSPKSRGNSIKNEIGNKLKEPSKKVTKKLDETIFKKPLPPNSFVKRVNYEQPENLAPYKDFDFDFNNIYCTSIENEVREFMSSFKKNIKPYEDDVDSEPELIPNQNLYIRNDIPLDDFDEYLDISPVKLLDVSDDGF
ncbi:uncharacterized protein [Prorops nasuta]|uniref:uncharacterized protein n=1 Tax=Prorops nasuta TaxID=863751 RepID=UPI0034CD1FA4